MKIRSLVQQVAAAEAPDATEYFSRKFRFETDCWDVNYALQNNQQDFLLVDVRSPDLYAAGHVPGAINLPHPQIDAETLAEYDRDTLFVVYCAGPHCNAAQRGAIRLSRLGRPVKEMIGGITGWLDEGLSLSRS